MLTEKDIKEIEKAIGVEDLAGKWTSEEVQELELKKKFHYTEAEQSQLVNNLLNDVPKEKWDEAKKAGIEMDVKAAKKEKGLDFEGKSLSSLIDYYESQLEKNKTSNDSELSKRYESDIEELRKVIKNKDKLITENETRNKQIKINNPIDLFFNSIEVNVPDGIEDKETYIKNQREKEKIYFKSQYNFDLDEHENITTIKDGEVLKDETRTPVKVDNLMRDYVSKNVVQVEQKVIKGRGEGDRLPSTSMTNLKSMDDLEKYAEDKGIKKGTSEFDAIYSEFKKNNN